MGAKEAAAMPLPREDTTPPVTKTSGVTEPGEVMGSAGRWKSAFYRFGAAPGACRPKNAASAASPPADHDEKRPGKPGRLCPSNRAAGPRRLSSPSTEERRVGKGYVRTVGA